MSFVPLCLSHQSYLRGTLTSLLLHPQASLQAVRWRSYHHHYWPRCRRWTLFDRRQTEDWSPPVLSPCRPTRILGLSPVCEQRDSYCSLQMFSSYVEDQKRAISSSLFVLVVAMMTVAAVSQRPPPVRLKADTSWSRHGQRIRTEDTELSFHASFGRTTSAQLAGPSTAAPSGGGHATRRRDSYPDVGVPVQWPVRMYERCAMMPNTTNGHGQRIIPCSSMEPSTLSLHILLGRMLVLVPTVEGSMNRGKAGPVLAAYDWGIRKLPLKQLTVHDSNSQANVILESSLDGRTQNSEYVSSGTTPLSLSPASDPDPIFRPDTLSL
nr:hypothetical protein CFP56_67701 [Quercus suber]